MMWYIWSNGEICWFKNILSKVKDLRSYLCIIYRAEHGLMTLLEINITDNALKYLVGCGLDLGSTIAKIGHKRLYTDGCESLKYYLLMTEINWTTIIKMQINFLSLSLNLIYSFLCCFYPVIFYKHKICWWRSVKVILM
jgi:hypothetical protein